MLHLGFWITSPPFKRTDGVFWTIGLYVWSDSLLVSSINGRKVGNEIITSRFY